MVMKRITQHFFATDVQEKVLNGVKRDIFHPLVEYTRLRGVV